MFGGGFRNQKLKTSLRLSINRLKLLEKKKTEMALKARREISDFLNAGKEDRARIRIENVILEDYMVEAMELVELYCDLLLARFDLIETMQYCDESLVEAVSSLIWVTPRLSTNCQELRTVSEQLCLKYGKAFYQQSLSNLSSTVNETLIQKMCPEPPANAVIDRYLEDIAKGIGTDLQPGAMPPRYPPAIPSAPYPPGSHIDPSQLPPIPPAGSDLPPLPDVPGLPSVIPSDTVPGGGLPSMDGQDVDFENLTKRFEELKKAQ